jgi:RNA polymerase sigma factor (sigma-70 family)
MSVRMMGKTQAPPILAIFMLWKHPDFGAIFARACAAEMMPAISCRKPLPDWSAPWRRTFRSDRQLFAAHRAQSALQSDTAAGKQAWTLPRVLDDGYEHAMPPDQGDRLEVADVMRIYRRALSELPDKTREVLLHRVEELPYREIGERLGLSIPTVQYHVARALAHIDAALEQE